MPTLFDALQKLKQPAPAAPASQQAELERIASARTGKQQTSTVPGASNLGEQRALAQGQTAANQQALAGAQVASGMNQAAGAGQQQQALAAQEQDQRFRNALAGLTQQTQLGQERQQQQRALATQRLTAQETMQLTDIQAKMQNQLTQLAADRNMNVDNLFTNFKRANVQLEDRKDASELEQLGFMMSLADKKYVDEIANIAKVRGLQNSLNFKQEALDVTIGNDLAATLDNIGLKKALGALERDANAAIASMSIDQAKAIAKSAALGGAASSIIEGGFDSYATYSKKQKEEENK